MRILVVPEQLRETSHLLFQAQTAWQDNVARIQAQYNCFDWETRQQLTIDRNIDEVIHLANDLAQHAGESAAFLESTAARFEAADSQSASILGTSIGKLVLPWLAGWQAFAPWLNFPESGLTAWQRLGEFLGGHQTAVTSVVATSGGASLLGVSFLSSLSIAGGSLQGVGECIWNWLHGYGWHTNIELLAPAASLQKAKTINNSQNKFDVINKEVPASTSATASASVKDTGSTIPKPEFGYSVVTLSQQGLKSNGKPTEYGCVPTSTSMVVQYWNSKDPKNKMLSPQELVDLNVGEKQFSAGSGMNTTNILDNVKNLGYSVAEDHINATFDQLKNDVQIAPVMATVKLGMQKSGYNHQVVVTGISDDGSKVMINDPWDGQSHLYTKTEFAASWGADFGGLKNIYTVIRP